MTVGIIGRSKRARQKMKTKTESLLEGARFRAATPMASGDQQTYWGVVQFSDGLAVPPPRYRQGGYYTWVIDDASPVQAGDVIARMHAHWRPLASDLKRQQTEKKTCKPWLNQN